MLADRRRASWPSTGCVLATGAQPRRLPGAGTHPADPAPTRSPCAPRLRPGARLVDRRRRLDRRRGGHRRGARRRARHGRRGAATGRSRARCRRGRRAAMLPWWSGVDLRLGAAVEAVEPDAVHLAGGERCPRTVVLVAVGARPDVPATAPDARPGAGPSAVDARLRTSLPGVWAVGDCAAWESARYGDPDARRALGRRAARARRSRRQRARRRRGLGPGALLLVRAVGPDGAVRRSPPRGRTASCGGRTATVGRVLAGRRPAGRRAHRRPAARPRAGPPADAARRDGRRRPARRPGASRSRTPWQACPRDRPADPPPTRPTPTRSRRWCPPG